MRLTSNTTWMKTKEFNTEKEAQSIKWKIQQILKKKKTSKQNHLTKINK